MNAVSLLEEVNRVTPPYAIVGLLACMVLGCIFVPLIKKTTEQSLLFNWLLFVAWTGAVAFTLTPANTFNPLGGLCHSLNFNQWWEQLFVISDVSLNVALFIPLGILIMFVKKYKRFLIVGCFATPVLIELIQKFIEPLNRACQLSDVLANLIGLSLGVIIGYLCVCFKNKKVKHGHQYDKRV